MLATLVVSLICNLLLLIAVFGLNYESKDWKRIALDGDKLVSEASNQRNEAMKQLCNERAKLAKIIETANE